MACSIPAYTPRLAPKQLVITMRHQTATHVCLALWYCPAVMLSWWLVISLIPRPHPFFFLFIFFCTSVSVQYNTWKQKQIECKPKNKNKEGLGTRLLMKLTVLVGSWVNQVDAKYFPKLAWKLPFCDVSAPVEMVIGPSTKDVTSW